jgi:type II secretory pathway component PulF
VATFRYQALGEKNGGGSAAVIEAPDRAAAVRELRRRGVVPVRLEPVSGADARREGASAEPAGPKLELEPARRPGVEAAAPAPAAKPGRMSRLERATLIRELATAVQAGLPLVQALRTIERQVKHPGQKGILQHLIHAVEHGRSLSDAMAGLGRTFGELVVSLVKAGEASGRLGEILEQTANLLDRDLKMRRTLIGGLIYPAFLAVLIGLAIGVMVGFIVPKILAPFKGKLAASALPFPTQVVLAVGGFVQNWWWAILLAAALVVVLVTQTYRSAPGRLAIDRFLLKVPVLGKVLREVAVARFTRTLGTLVSSGLPALSALRITKGTLGNKAMEGVVERVCEQVSGGKTISEPMERSGYFPSLLTQIIGLGERSGRLPQMLVQAAGVFEDRTEASLKAFTASFPVVMMLFAAGVISFVMAGVLLPLIQMQDLVGR